MKKYYKEALIEAAADRLKEQEGIEDVDMPRLRALMDDPEWDIETDDYSFEGDTQMLVDMYLSVILSEEEEEREEVASGEGIEEQIEEICNKLHIGFNFVPGIGVGYCRNEEDLEAMRNFVRGGIAILEMSAEL